MKNNKHIKFHNQAQTVRHAGAQLEQARSCWNAVLQHSPAYF